MNMLLFLTTFLCFQLIVLLLVGHHLYTIFYYKRWQLVSWEKTGIFDYTFTIKVDKYNLLNLIKWEERIFVVKNDGNNIRYASTGKPVDLYGRHRIFEFYKKILMEETVQQINLMNLDILNVDPKQTEQAERTEG